MSKFVNKVKKMWNSFMYETDEDDEEKSAEVKQDPASIIEEPVINITPISEQELTQEIAPVEVPHTNYVEPEQTVKKQSKSAPTYLNVEPQSSNPFGITEKQSENFQELINEITPQKKQTWQPRPVISPIFGNQNQANTTRVVAKNKVETEYSNNSVMGTVFSPISGKDTIRVTKQDVVDEKIASKTTSDFIEDVPVEKPLLNIYKDTPSFSKAEMPPLKKETEQSSSDEEVNEQISLF